MTEKELDSTLVELTSKMLGRSIEDILSDNQSYAAFHYDDGFIDDGFENINLDTLQIEDQMNENSVFWNRHDFDLEHSLFEDGLFNPENTTDKGLREWYSDQAHSLLGLGSYLFGCQLKNLISESRIHREDFEQPFLIGRIRSDSKLLNVMKALLRLNSNSNSLLEETENYEIDESCEPWLKDIKDKNLQTHLGYFFQSPDMARCTGAFFEHIKNEDTFLSIGKKPIMQCLAKWHIGEGQGMVFLVRILDNSIPEIPFKGNSVIEIKKSYIPYQAPLTQSQLKELLEKKLITVLKEWKNVAIYADSGVYYLQGWTGDIMSRLCVNLEGRDETSFFRGLRIRGGLEGFVDCIEKLTFITEQYQIGLRALEQIKEETSEKLLAKVLYIQSHCYERLHLYNEAIESAKKAWSYAKDLENEYKIPSWKISNIISLAACKNGQHDIANEWIKKSLEFDSHPEVQEVLGNVLFSKGDLKESMIAVEKGFQAKSHYFNPLHSMTESPEYKELAIKYNVPIIDMLN